MMDPILLAFLLLALAGVVFSAVFSGLETGLYTINRVRLAVRASHNDPAAVRLRRIVGNPNQMLATLLIGNNMANYAGSFGIAAILEHKGVSPVQAILINACILIPVLFIVGETLPKDLFRTYTDRWSYAFSGFLAACDRMLTWIGLVPIARGFGTLVGRIFGADASAAVTARQRVSHLIKEGISVGVLSEVQTTLADRALAMRDHTVRDEMIAWSQVAHVPQRLNPEARNVIVRKHHHTRFPVTNENGKVVGYISMLDVLLQADRPTEELLQPTVIFEADISVRRALRRMQTERCQMAVVAQKTDGRPIGLVTIKDLVEPLTGELAAW